MTSENVNFWAKLLWVPLGFEPRLERLPSSSLTTTKLVGHASICRLRNFDRINYVQADSSTHQLVKTSKYTSPARHPSAHDSNCILLSQDLKFLRGACFAQLLNPDHENLGEWLRTFCRMCTLSNCIFQSICCLCVFVPLLNLKKQFYGCNLIYTAGNNNIVDM